MDLVMRDEKFNCNWSVIGWSIHGVSPEMATSPSMVWDGVHFCSSGSCMLEWVVVGQLIKAKPLDSVASLGRIYVTLDDMPPW